MSDSLIDLFTNLGKEIQRQRDLWGEQNHPDGTNLAGDDRRAADAKLFNAVLVDINNLTWRDILIEEVFEVFAESDPDKIQEELVQVAAVALSWAEAIERRKS